MIPGTKIYFSFLFVLLLAAACNVPKQEESAPPPIEAEQETKAEPVATEPEAFSEDDCIFDLATQTTEFLDTIPQLQNYTWNDTMKVAMIPQKNGDVIEISKGGCHHYGYYVTLHSPVDSTKLDDLDHWLNRIRPTMKLLPDFEWSMMEALLADKAFDLESSESMLFCTFHQPTYCDMSILVGKGEGGVAYIQVGYYFC